LWCPDVPRISSKGRPCPIPFSFITGNWRRRASANFFKPGRPASIPSIMHARMEWSDQQNALIGLRRDGAKPLERIPVM
jgi:hypothetical protein